MQSTEETGRDNQRWSVILVLAPPLSSECHLECSPSCFSTKICFFSLLGNVVFGLTVAGDQLLPLFTGELTLTFVFMLSFTPIQENVSCHMEISAFILAEGTGSCIFRTGQNTLVKATSAFPIDTDALCYEITLAQHCRPSQDDPARARGRQRKKKV